jgi:hypothetical protein
LISINTQALQAPQLEPTFEKGAPVSDTTVMLLNAQYIANNCEIWVQVTGLFKNTL